MTEDNNSKKCVVIQNGTNTTLAGFNNVDLPQCVIPTVYIQDNSTQKKIFGNFELLDIASSRSNDDAGRYEVFTIFDRNGLPYNWDALKEQWEYIYREVLKCNSDEYPLVITIPSANKDVDEIILKKYFELAFETFNVPVLQIIIEPLAVALSLGKSSSLVVNLGASGCNVTPIVDGTVIKHAVMKSKYGGDFLDFQIVNILQEKGKLESGNTKDSVDIWFDANTWIKEFKSTMLQVTDKPLQDVKRYYQDQTDMYIKQHEEIQQYNSTVKDTSNASAIAAASAANKTCLLYTSRCV